MTSNARSIQYLQSLGFTCQVVEKWNPWVRRPDGGKGVRVDLFSVIDIIAIGPGLKRPLGVQATTQSEKGRHLVKIMAEPKALKWLKSGGDLVLHCWAKRGPRGKRKTWQLEETKIKKSDYVE